MILAWIAARKWLLIIGAVIAIGAGYLLWLSNRDAGNVEKGKTEQTVENLEETVNRVDQANEARDTIRVDNGNARFDQCMRTARTPANCQRFLPSGEAPKR